MSAEESRRSPAQRYRLRPGPNSVCSASPFQVVRKIKFLLGHLDRLQLLLLLVLFLLVLFLCPSFLWPLLPYRKSEDYWVSVTPVLEKSWKEGDAKEPQTHGEAGRRGFVSAAGALPLRKCLESQTHLLLATPP